MAVGVVMDFEGATLDQYDEVTRLAGLEHGGSTSHSSCLFHWVTGMPSGIRVTDVWTSREQFEAVFAQMLPLFEQAGYPDPAGAHIEVFDVHDYLAPAR